MHPDLGGGFGPGFKVEKGYDFVGDNATIPGVFRWDIALTYRSTLASDECQCQAFCQLPGSTSRS